MSTLAIIVIVAVVVLVLVFLGGLAATRRRAAAGAADYERHVAAADRALEQARAGDRGWERGALEQAARRALADQKPEYAFDDLFLVLVDDRPGIDEDRAHFTAVGADGEARVVLVRDEGRWVPETVERG